VVQMFDEFAWLSRIRMDIELRAQVFSKFGAPGDPMDVACNEQEQNGRRCAGVLGAVAINHCHQRCRGFPVMMCFRKEFASDSRLVKLSSSLPDFARLSDLHHAKLIGDFLAGKILSMAI